MVFDSLINLIFLITSIINNFNRSPAGSDNVAQSPPQREEDLPKPSEEAMRFLDALRKKNIELEYYISLSFSKCPFYSKSKSVFRGKRSEKRSLQ
jgi:hypothetical protein